MKTFKEIFTESSQLEYVDTRLSQLFSKQGLEPKIQKKLGFTKYSFDDFDVVNDGVNIIVKQNKKEIAVINDIKLNYSDVLKYIK